MPRNIDRETRRKRRKANEPVFKKAIRARKKARKMSDAVPGKVVNSYYGDGVVTVSSHTSYLVGCASEKCIFG